MRYDEPILFITPAESDHYDPVLGEWIEGEPTVTTTEANVTDVGTDLSIAIFGQYKQGAKVVRTQPLFVIPEKWETIEIDGKRYQLTTARHPLYRNSLIVEEVVTDGS